MEAPSRAGPSDLGEDGSLSRDLVALYFRQMGDVELLSRAQELALAKRIEGRQRAMVEGLSQVPVLIDRIGLWVSELHQGGRDARDLVDLSVTDEELADPAQGAASEDGDPPRGDAGRGGRLPPADDGAPGRHFRACRRDHVPQPRADGGTGSRPQSRRGGIAPD